MSSIGEGKRTRKFVISLTEAERAALEDAAERLGIPRATLAARLVRVGVMGAAAGEQLTFPATSEGASPTRHAMSGDDAGEPSSKTPDRRASWLERGRGSAWRTWAWNAGEDLRARFPELAKSQRLPANWIVDEFTRNGLLALATWRHQLDRGAHDDPRMELAWQRALREFHVWLEQRAPHVGEPPPLPRDLPKAWAQELGRRPSS